MTARLRHRTVYLSGPLQAHLETEERLTGKSPSVALTRAALADLVGGASPSSAAGRYARRLRSVSTGEKVLSVLEPGKGVPLEVVVERVGGVDANTVHECLINLSRLRDEDDRALVVADRIEDNGPVLWSLAP